MNEQERERLKRDILAYLSERPNAQDTAEGIVRFWLLFQHIEECVDDVQEALTSLVDEGSLTVTSMPPAGGRGQKVFYKLVPRKKT